VETFLVRLWRAAPGEPPGAELRGVVRSVGTGAELVFASGEELLAFLREPSASDRGTFRPGPGERGEQERSDGDVQQAEGPPGPDRDPVG
jgi:hypothetical protein